MQNSDLPTAAPADISPLNSDLISALTFSVPKQATQAILHIGKTKLEGLLGLGLLDGVKNGPRTEITIESIRRYQRSLPPAVFKKPPPPRFENLEKLHERQRERAKRRADRRKARARAQ
jgi:hypothetical protein